MNAEKRSVAYCIRDFTISRCASLRGGFLFCSALPLFEPARVLVRLDHFASFDWLGFINVKLTVGCDREGRCSKHREGEENS